MTKIADLMTAGPVPIDAQQSLTEAMHRMDDFRFRHLPVVDGPKLVGILSQVQILRYLHEHPQSELDRIRVAQVMQDVFAVTPDAPAMAIARTMVERRLDAAVIVDQGRITGIFTATDALRSLAESEPEGRPAPASAWPQRILCAVDFSAGSRQAAQVALELASRSGGAVTLFHSFDLPAAALEAATVGAAALGRLERETDASLRALREDLARPGGPLLHLAHGVGDAVETITRHAHDRGFEIIVVGTHGRTGLSRVFLGSVAENVARHAPCPVLIVRVTKKD